MYALKGYSLTGETLRKLINDVRNKCKEYGITVQIALMANGPK